MKDNNLLREITRNFINEANVFDSPKTGDMYGRG